MQHCDIAIVGAGTAGIPAAIEAVQAGARVVLIEQSDRVGGTLHISAAQMSGAGTRLQRERGITDTPQAHLDDAIRISRGTCDAALVAKATELGGSTIDWLMDLGFDMDPVCPAILHFHEAYRTQRTYWGRDGGRSVLQVLLPLLDAAMARPNATLMLGTEVVSLLRDVTGAVSGLRLGDRDNGAVSELYADAVVLASGGYAGNPALFARLTDGASLYTPALAIASGSGIEMAEAIGARIRGGEHFIPTFAGIEEADGKGHVLWDHLPSLTPQVRQPWEIYVGPDGRRFVREDIDSVDARERALMRLPGLTFWTVFDDAILRDLPPLLPGWRADELERAWNSSACFAAANTVEELARRAGIDPAGLAMSVQQYNAAIGNDAADPLGRVHRPVPIATPPYRAIRMHGIVLKTPAGLAVNTDLNVLDGHGTPIGNLYAIGEAIGGATLSGNSFVGGMSVTPALSFGRWLGRELGRRYARAAA